jgi:hypothetical protein
MAWSNAARAAALAARRMHSHARREAHGLAVSTSELYRQTAIQPSTRKRIAQHLRAFRKGGAAMRKSIKLGYSAQSGALTKSIYHEAAISTALRNMAKRYKKRR